MMVAGRGPACAGRGRWTVLMMPRRARHISAGIAWVVASLFAWSLVGRVFAFVVFEFLGNERHVELPDWTTDVFNWTGIAGAVLIPPVVALLAMRSKLPWTGERPPKTRGFSAEGSQPPGAAERSDVL